MNTQLNANELKQKITKYLEELARETDLARKTDTMQKYLEFVGKFHKYSTNNVWLILMAKPNASHVGGFQTWKKMNRYVKHGEKGIAILAPQVRKEDPDDVNSTKILTGFRVVYIFDVSQTTGDPLPTQPNWRSPEKSQELQDRLIRYIQSKGVSVSVEPLPRGIQGVSMEGKILLDPESGFKSACHEYTHSCLHQSGNNRLSHAERETEAESVAFVVCRHYGFKDLASPNYLVLNHATRQMIVASTERIQRTASEIIQGINGLILEPIS